MKRLLLSWILVWSSLTGAVEVFESEGSLIYLYSEDRVWTVDRFTPDQNAWPRLDQRRHFSSETAARAALPTDKERPTMNFADVELKSQSGATLWNATQNWNAAWEQKYTDWVIANITPTWWKENNLATDCADVVYTARWIFARDHGLPMANHTITGHIFSHNSVRPEWENLPTDPDWRRDQKFLAALDYLLRRGYTHSLWQDSYPVAINEAALVPGGYHLYLKDQTGHTQFIYKVGTRPDEVPMITLNSTVPRALRILNEYVFFEKTSNIKNSGFVRMRWPVFREGQPVEFVEPANMPHYSLEQFATDFIRGGRRYFWREVFYRLNPRADYDQIAIKTVQQIVESFQARVSVVNEGFEKCRQVACTPGSPDYEAWSTPSRDYRIRETVQIYDGIAGLISSMSKVQALLRTPIMRAGWRTYRANQFINVWRAERYTSDPNDRPAVRWGLRYL